MSNDQRVSKNHEQWNPTEIEITSFCVNALLPRGNHGWARTSNEIGCADGCSIDGCKVRTARGLRCAAAFLAARICTGWWFGTFFIFPYIGNVIIPIDSYFSEGWPNHQPVYIFSNLVEVLFWATVIIHLKMGFSWIFPEINQPWIGVPTRNPPSWCRDPRDLLCRLQQGPRPQDIGHEMAVEMTNKTPGWWWMVAMNFIFPEILGMSNHPNWLIFFRGVAFKPPTNYICESFICNMILTPFQKDQKWRSDEVTSS